VSTRALRGEGGRVVALQAVRVALEGGKLRELPETAFEIPCDLVLLAMGFTGPERTLVDDLGVAVDARGNVRTDASGATSEPRIFAAGDVSRGQSLVVWAIADGRRVAAGVDAWLGRSANKSAQKSA
jgi:glutamate synthase (NADPH/NADH) small chain